MAKFRKDNRKRKKVAAERNQASGVAAWRGGEEPPEGVSGYHMVIDNHVVTQSPIELKTSKAETWIPPQLISFTGYWTAGSEVLALNNGITALLCYVNRPQPPVLRGGPLTHEFIFSQLHFHWSQGDHSGSEHSIDGQKFAGEAHLVHYNSRYNGFDEAASQPDGLAVIGLLLKVSKNPNTALQPITDAVKKIQLPAQKTRLASEDTLNWMLDIDLNECYFTYSGSLTTDPFYESVTWIVYEKTINISKCQMKSFRSMSISYGGKKMNCNSRAIQETPSALKVLYVKPRETWFDHSQHSTRSKL